MANSVMFSKGLDFTKSFKSTSGKEYPVTRTKGKFVVLVIIFKISFFIVKELLVVGVYFFSAAIRVIFEEDNSSHSFN